jgi:hypothetical protein
VRRSRIRACNVTAELTREPRPSAPVGRALNGLKLVGDDQEQEPALPCSADSRSAKAFTISDQGAHPSAPLSQCGRAVSRKSQARGRRRGQSVDAHSARNASRAAHRRRQDAELRRFTCWGPRSLSAPSWPPTRRCYTVWAGQCRVAGHPTMRRRISAERRDAIYRASVEPCCGAVADPFVDGGSRPFTPNNPRSSSLRLSREIALDAECLGKFAVADPRLTADELKVPDIERYCHQTQSLCVHVSRIDLYIISLYMMYCITKWGAD